AGEPQVVRRRLVILAVIGVLPVAQQRLVEGIDGRPARPGGEEQEHCPYDLLAASRPHPLAPSPKGEGETRFFEPLSFRRGVGVRSIRQGRLGKHWVNPFHAASGSGRSSTTARGLSVVRRRAVA